MQAHKYFEQETAQSEAGEAYYSQILTAHKRNAGDTIIVNNGFNQEKLAEEDGWQIYHEGRPMFLTVDEFKEKTLEVPIEGNEIFPEDGNATPVLAGEDVILFSPDLGMHFETTTESAGYVVELPENRMMPVFMSDTDFRARFKTDAAPLDPTEEQLHVRYKPQADDAPVRYIVLDQDVTFDFEEGEYEAKQGMYLYENPMDVDGYTVVHADYFQKNFLISSLPGFKLLQNEAGLEHDVVEFD